MPGWSDYQAGSNIELKDNEIHIWIAPLYNAGNYSRICLPTLASDEFTKANRFYFQEDRERFVFCRGLLRIILGRYLSIPPAEVIIDYGINGKPYVNNTKVENLPEFNISHSRGLALLAFSRASQLGIDIEYNMDESIDINIAKHFFSERENSYLFSLPEQQRRKAFFDCWTRKEAFIKAIGDGLSYPLENFDVSLYPDKLIQELIIHSGEIVQTDWSLINLTIDSDYSAAMVTKSNPRKIKYYMWNVFIKNHGLEFNTLSKTEEACRILSENSGEIKAVVKCKKY